MKARPLSASRTAEVATATVRLAPLPTMRARKSLSASIARSMAAAERVWLRSSCRTSLSEALLLARMRRLAWGWTA
jgi:hypothetical protein